jgi:hypothetical protein
MLYDGGTLSRVAPARSSAAIARGIEAGWPRRKTARFNESPVRLSARADAVNGLIERDAGGSAIAVAPKDDAKPLRNRRAAAKEYPALASRHFSQWPQNMREKG